MVLQLPARRVPEAVRLILERFARERAPGEDFRAYLARVGATSFRPLLEPLQTLVPPEAAPDLYRDLGSEEAEFQVSIGQGECNA
ncbi:hypothetical protein [Limnochorda pilosa]|uniref:Uncharacterized protein n=1 Tax=Limnochorda pilosa TaxID=1555112 RepID=A0A0K2SPX8_LIMPI|nr:hypothetical protein [Limnochorda pilosa]BAS29170.1 hypothetical protein LIP_3358 [Limnochorda pilosa]